MGQKFTIKAMVARKRQIADALISLEKEKSEIALALKVLQRYARGQGAEHTRVGSQRPKDAPTNLEMAVSVLQGAGASGLAGGEMVRAIEEKFWPGLRGPQFLPVLYRLSNQGKLRKEGNRFYLPEETAK